MPWSMSSIIRGKIKKYEMKNEKKIHTWVFVFQKYGQFWSILLGHFIKHKPLFSEECQHKQNIVKKSNGRHWQERMQGLKKNAAVFFNTKNQSCTFF